MHRDPCRAWLPECDGSAGAPASRLIAGIICIFLALASPLLAEPAARGKAIAFQSSRVPTRVDTFTVLCTDLDGDGRADLVLSHPRLASVSTCLGNGDGTFAACSDLGRVGTNVRGLAVADFNRDGASDIVAGASGDLRVMILNGMGHGRFAAAQAVAEAKRPFMLTAVDLSQDGIPDVAVSEEGSGLVVLLADGRGRFTSTKYKTGDRSSDTAAADFNEDGKLDLAVANWGSDDVSILLGLGGGKFAPATNVTYEGDVAKHRGMYRVLTGDFDRDAHVDLLWTDIKTRSVYVLYGDGAGRFPRRTSVLAGQGVRHVSVADFNVDGWLDLLSTNSADNDVTLILGDGHGGFEPIQRVPVGRQPRTSATCDLNDDGRPDAIVSSMNDEGVTVLLNQGISTQPAAAGLTQRKDVGDTLHEPSALAIAGDGRLLAADEGNHRVVAIDTTTGAVSTIAGTGVKGFGGDGGRATDAQLNEPAGLATDAAGAIYIADSGNRRVRRVDANGVITTVAGNGTDEVSGDGAPAIAAGLGRPLSLVMDAARTLYIADAGNQGIRAVDAAGIISTLNTTGWPDTGAHSITGLTSDSGGNLIVVSRLQQRVFKRDRDGNLAPVAGNGKSGNGGDGGLAVDALLAFPIAVARGVDGAIYIADTGNNGIRVVGPDGRIRTLASSNTAPAAPSPWQPNGVAVDANGTVYLSDRQNDCIRRVDSSGKVTMLVGRESTTGRSHSAEVTADTLPLLPLSPESAPVSQDWEYVFLSGSDDNAIYGVVAGDTDTAYLAGDIGTGADWRIQEMSAGHAGWHFDWGGPGVDTPYALARTADGGLVAAGMLDAGGDRDVLVVRLGPDGKERWRYTESRPGVQVCAGVALDPAGNVYLACESDQHWEVASLDGNGQLRWRHTDPGEGKARSISVDRDGQVFVAGEEPQGWRVMRLLPDGNQVWQHRIRGRAIAYGVAATGDGGAIVVGSRTSQRLNMRVERLGADGAVVWEYEAACPAGAMVGRAVTLDDKGRAYIAGEIATDWLVLALDENGKRRWYFTHDGGGGLKNRDQALAVAFAAPNRLLVAGRIHRLPLIPPSLGQVEWRAVGYQVKH